MALLCTFLGRMILSPALQTERIIPWTASGSSYHKGMHDWHKGLCCCQFLCLPDPADTGWHRLSKGFMEFTSNPTHFPLTELPAPGFPRPLFVPPVHQRGTTRFFLKRSNAS